MASLIQNGAQFRAANATSFTPSITGVTAHNTLLMVAVMSQNTGNAPVPTDSSGQTWVLANATTPNGPCGYAVFVLYDAAAGTHNLTWGPSSGTWAVCEIIETVPLTAFDLAGTHVSNTTTSPTTVSSITTTGATGLLIGIMGVDSNVGNASMGIDDPPTGFTSIDVYQDSTTYIAGEWCYKDVTAGATGSISWAYSTTDTGQSIIGQLVAFTKAAGTPTINTQPTDQTVNEGSTATFTVSATASAGSLTYQWQDNSTGSFANIGGATSASYTTGTASYAMQGRLYQCIVTDSNGSTTSGTAALRVAYNLAGTGPKVQSAWGNPFGAGAFGLVPAFPAPSGGGATNYTLSCAKGTYSETGYAATLRVARTFAGAAGSYAVSGKTATFHLGHALSASAGVYSETGYTAAFKRGYSLSDAAGSYSLTGYTATLTYTPGAGAVHYTLTCAAGSYAVTGYTATLKVAHSLTAAVGSYSLSGNASGLKYGRTLSGSAGSYAETGNAATLKVAHSLNAAAGSYGETGYTAGLTYTGHAPTAYGLTCAKGSYSLTGNDASFAWSGEIIVQPLPAGFSYGRREKKRVKLEVIDALSGTAAVAQEVREVVRKYVVVPKGIDLPKEAIAPADEFRAAEIDWTALAKDWQEVQKIIVRAKRKQQREDEESMLLLM